MVPESPLPILRQNLDSTQREIEQACKRAGRSPSEIKIVAITKYVDARIMRFLYEAGCRSLGENRADDYRQKHELLDDLPIDWHFVGHLQRNKIKWIVPTIDLIQSVDSERLARSLNDAAREHGKICRILLEVNISGEADKTGISPESLRDIMTEASQLSWIRVEGLMGMAALNANDDQTRQQFRFLNQLRDDLSSYCSDKDPLHELSMGMSGDFPIAIECGATIIRIGSRLFEGLL